MGKCITTDNTIKRLTELERQRCCNRNQFLPTFDDFPTTGEDNVLYIDKEKSKIYLWNGSIYITADDLVGHTNVVATTTYDSLNPLTGWVAPTTPYFGNTATVLFTDDIIVNFTFNGTIWEEKIIDDTAISGIKTSKTVYVDGTYGDDTTGQRESRDFPFQTFTQAMSVYEDGDWLKYENSDEAISGTNISPLLTKYYYDFGNGDITINSGGNAFIGPQNFTDVTTNDVNIKNEGVFTSNKALFSFRNGKINLDLNKWVTSTYAFGTKDDVNIRVKDLITSNLDHCYYSPSNKTLNFYVDNIEITNLSTSGYLPFFLNFEVSGENSTNNTLDINVGNYTNNSAFGGLIATYSRGSNNYSLDNNIISVNVKNYSQSSAFVNYLDDVGSRQFTRSIFQVFRSNGTTIQNNNILTVDVENSNTDYSVQHEDEGGQINNANIIVNVKNSICNKLSSFRFNVTATKTFNNSNETVTGNYTNNSIKPIIHLEGLSLTNNSTMEYNGNFTANTNVSLASVTIDATSKIVFKGRYELGAGYFDISGVTGAGADNVYFEDCTIITDNAECIVSGSAKNVKILNVRSNKPTSVNVTELISSILVNVNIN